MGCQPCSLPEDHNSPDLLGSGAVEWAAIPDLDVFFRNLYRWDVTWRLGCVCPSVGGDEISGAM